MTSFLKWALPVMAIASSVAGLALGHCAKPEASPTHEVTQTQAEPHLAPNVAHKPTQGP